MIGKIFIDSNLLKQVKQETCKDYGIGDLVSIEELIQIIEDLLEVIQNER